MTWTEEHIKWIWGAIIGLVLLRSFKVATSTAITNTVAQTATPFAHAGGLSIAGLLDVPGITKTSAPVFIAPTQQGVNVGAEAGSTAENQLQRQYAIAADSGNSYTYTDPVSGVQSTMWINTAGVVALSMATMDYTWGLVFDPDPSNDSSTPLGLCNLGFAYANIISDGTIIDSVSLIGIPPGQLSVYTASYPLEFPILTSANTLAFKLVNGYLVSPTYPNVGYGHASNAPPASTSTT